MVEYVYVMYLGTIVEEGPVEDIFGNPRHPYTVDLLRSIPRMDDVKELYAIKGAVPSSIPSGCPFHTRCGSYMGKICEENSPPGVRIDDEHFVRCFLYGEDAVHDADDSA